MKLLKQGKSGQWLTESRNKTYHFRERQTKTRNWYPPTVVPSVTFLIVNGASYSVRRGIYYRFVLKDSQRATEAHLRTNSYRKCL